MSTRSSRRARPVRRARPGRRPLPRVRGTRPYVWIAASLAVAVPIVMDPGAYFIFMPLKWALAGTLVAAALAALLLDRRPVAGSAPVVAWLVLLAVLGAAAAVGVGGLTSWIGYPGRYLGVLAWVVFFGAFVLGASVLDAADRARMVAIASGASIVVSLYALSQEVGIDPIDWSEELDVSRTRSFLGNAAFLGAYLALVVPLAGRMALSPAQSVRTRAVHAVAALLGVVALLTTETRGAWLGALAGAVVVLALERRRLRATPRRTAVLLGASLLAIVVLAVVGPYASRIRSIADPGAATGRGRLLQWDRTVELIADRPVLGWGPDTYAFTFPPYIDAEFERKVGRDVVPDRAHNVVLDLGAAAGVLGVVAFIAVVVLIGRAVARASEQDPVAVGLAGGCVAYLVQLQLGFPLAHLDAVAWLFAGLLLASTGAPTRLLSRRWAAVPVGAALALAAWGGADAVADRTLRRSLEAESHGDVADARRLVDRAASVGLGRAQYLQAEARLRRRVGEATRSANEFPLALDALDDARRLVPGDLELDLDRGDLFLAWGEVARDPALLRRAARQYENILDDDPASSRVHLKLGVAYIELDRPADAEHHWRTAAALAPRAPGPRANLGVLYERQGRDDEARRMLRAALALDPDNGPARAALRRLDT